MCLVVVADLHDYPRLNFSRWRTRSCWLLYRDSFFNKSTLFAYASDAIYTPVVLGAEGTVLAVDFEWTSVPPIVVGAAWAPFAGQFDSSSSL